MSDQAVQLPRMAPRASGVRLGSWWAKAWMRAVEESAFTAPDLQAGRTLARRGLIGQLTVEPGRWFAAVEDAAHQRLYAPHTASVELPVLSEEGQEAFVELVQSRAGRWAALASGKLDHALAEEAEEAGIELVPYGGEFTASCTCEAWTDPCRHALALMVQLGWALEADVRVLLRVRGMTGDFFALDPAATQGAGSGGGVEADLRTAYAAVVAARRALDEIQG